jgi:hypothetical protein
LPGISISLIVNLPETVYRIGPIAAPAWRVPFFAQERAATVETVLRVEGHSTYLPRTVIDLGNQPAYPTRIIEPHEIQKGHVITGRMPATVVERINSP